ncbi:inositol 1,4,5-trisphosphate receptor-interacting protein [Echeneis naucrates]|uniref:Inositol 1,4,5-trisphosphate receptor-interacting protein n=1 Tax=Echeneis naucrates TaxID=173247 RepID=A0A665SYD2_ECHNA|nr:inositol 1,4,5-trisphosphate receptor-interacting protein-like [Echeneis naucrates]XP_029361921.1 inositol 1,4,5-trisphosphate receptor-interacting protein-like [Echeneis naucrates]
MQDTLLRVFLVALGLLMCPRDDPELEEEFGNIQTARIQMLEEKLLKDQALHQEVAPNRDKITHTDDKGPQKTLKNITKEQTQPVRHGADNQKTSVSEEGIPKEAYAGNELSEGGQLIANADVSQPQKSRNEPKTLRNSPTDLDMRLRQGGDIQSETIRPLGQQDKPEEMEASSLSEVHIKVSENDASETVNASWEADYLWYIWNIFSTISMIRFLRKYFRSNPQMKHDDARTPFQGTCVASAVSLPDSDTLQSFYSQCVQVSSKEKWREAEFLEGFANHMVETMRTICDGGMLIEGCQMLDACDIIVPLTPAEPYSFQCLLWSYQERDMMPDWPVCGQIKVIENQIQNDCPCQLSNADDMVCLLHCDNESVKIKCTDACDDVLCQEDTSFLSKSQVTRWFQSTLKQAWALISYKYDFVLSIRNIDAPGALLVRFRSGKKISFNLSPVVKFNSAAHFYITPSSPSSLDTYWTFSLHIYEDQLLKHLSRLLPENACHMPTFQIASFLHKKQKALSGFSVLKDFHFKTALMHLLLTKDPSQWKPEYVACRLWDLLDFMERSLEKKLLPHILIGNPLIQNIIHLPTEVQQAKPVNLFHPLVAEDCLYKHALMHFQEMLRNAHMLIHDYVK